MYKLLSSFILLLLFAACQCCGSCSEAECCAENCAEGTCCQEGKAACADTQALLEQLAAENKDIVRLTVHATPPEAEHMIAIASTAPAKLGKKSDPEDLDAIATGQTVVLDEGEFVDVTVPFYQQDGKFIAATGVTLKATDHQEAIKTARAIAAKIETAWKKMMAEKK